MNIMLPAASRTPNANPLDSAPSRLALEKMREIQKWGDTFSPAKPSPGATAPDLCLAASKFLVGKLAGLFPASQHLNDFLQSGEAQSAASAVGDMAGVRKAWGGSLSMLQTFNDKVLPASLKWAQLQTGNIRFAQVWSHASRGDQLLTTRVPLVVGVSLHGTGSRDHFIATVMDAANEIWAIDPWGNWTSASVVHLPRNMTFTKGLTVEMNAGTTRIPCKHPFFGYYEKDGQPLTLSVAM
jgi:hypothetical protein